MLRNKLFIVVVGVLFAAVVIYNLNFFLKKKVPVGPQLKAVTVVLPDAQDRPGELRMTSHFQVPRDKENWKRDPFGIKEEAGKAGQGDGIIRRDGKSHALINGGVYTANQRIGGSVIKEIRRESVVLSTNGTIHEIYLDDYKVVKEKKK